MKAATKPAAKPAVKNTKNALPVKELKVWLKGRKFWSHNDWLALLENLRKKGYASLTDTQEGRETIGKYLESNRIK